MIHIKKLFAVFSLERAPIGLVLALEVMAVVLGVVLGYWLNDWRDARAQIYQAEHALHMLGNEILYNHQQIEMKYMY